MIATVSTGAAVASSSYFSIQQFIEGYNLADMDFGLSTAKTFTVSFWVRSSVTGTFGVGFRNSAFDLSYWTTYTINSANTWEQKSVTIAGPTTGTWYTNNSYGLNLIFSLGCGSTNKAASNNAWNSGGKLGAVGETDLIATTGATFYITGVQLEKGSAATAFEYRQYGTELALCQRYFSLMAGGGACGTAESTNRASVTYQFPVPMRATPTGTLNASKGSLSQPQGGPNSLTTMSSFFFGTTATAEGGWCVIDMSNTPFTTGRVIINNGTTGMLQFSAEL